MLQDLAASIGADATFDSKFFAMMGVVFIAGMIRGYTGFGSALLTVPALAYLYGPVPAVAIEILLEVPVVLGLLPVSLREAERRTVMPMLGMFVLFVPVGTGLLTVIEPTVVQIAMSLFVLFSVFVMSRQTELARLFSPGTNLLVGAVSGTTQGLTGMAGPLFATALLARGDSNSRTRANITTLAAGIIAVSVISFWLFGLFTAEIVFYAALATPTILFGVWAGAWLFRRGGENSFRPVILWFLTASAIVTLYQTVT